jgi:hypothetical protein
MWTCHSNQGGARTTPGDMKPAISEFLFTFMCCPSREPAALAACSLFVIDAALVSWLNFFMCPSKVQFDT